VLVWVKALLIHGFGGCGAFTPWQEEQAVLTKPPVKEVPWQIWQVEKPCMAAALGADFA
jgi:hypothetical protein